MLLHHAHVIRVNCRGEKVPEGFFSIPVEVAEECRVCIHAGPVKGTAVHQFRHVSSQGTEPLFTFPEPVKVPSAFGEPADPSVKRRDAR